jgi:DNA-binding response OmpR family regulator
MLVVEHTQIKDGFKGEEPMMPHTMRILCADHDLDTCGMITYLLGSEGYEVKIATRVSDTLRMARSERFDLYLLDDLFEDGGGLELLSSIRTFDRETPVIIYSADGRESARQEALENGAQAFITKPSEIEPLINTVRRLVAETATIAP